MKFKQERKNFDLIKTITQTPLLQWGAVVAAIVLVAGSFVAGAYAHKAGYTALLRNVFLRISKQTESIAEVVENDLKFLEQNGLEDLYLDIPFLSQESIRAQRDEALRIGILNVSDENFVPASIQSADNGKIDVDIRLKGDLTDHLEGEKWSLRIETDNDQSILGFKRFSIQAPETRQFLNEWAYHQHLLSEGILTTRYQFINVIINGSHKGIYALEESFSETMLDAQERREGIIIRFDEDLLWHNWSSFLTYGGNDLLDTAKVSGLFQIADDDSAPITIFRSGRVESNPALIEQATSAIGLLRSFQKGELRASQVFNVKILGRYFAITDLWGAGHGTAWHNIRFYYNPITALLEPIAYDGDTLDPYFNTDTPSFPFSNSGMFQDPLIQKVYVEELERITNPDYVQQIIDEINPQFTVYQQALMREYTDGIDTPWDLLETRRKMLYVNLKPVEAVRGGYEKLLVDEKKFIRLDLINQTILPVEINKFILNGNILEPELGWYFREEGSRNHLTSESIPLTLLPGHSVIYEPAIFTFQYDWPDQSAEDIAQGIDDFTLTVEVNIAGSSYVNEIPILKKTIPQGIRETQILTQPTLEEFTKSHPFVKQVSDTDLLVETGEWLVDGDLIVPSGFQLTIPEGTTLKFDHQAILYASDAVHLIGSSENPVTLTSQYDSWGGVVVLNARNASVWKYGLIENLKGIERGGWILTGGITFFESNIEMQHTRINNSFAEDALNVIHAQFEFLFSEFSNTISDGFDGDWIEGNISNCSFHDIGGDAIDVSGSEITIKDTIITDVVDKGVSIGENSRAEMNYVSISNIGIGVASKDLSQVHITNSRISSAEIGGIAAYIKKATYGPASIIADTVVFLDTEIIALTQIGNSIIINGIPENPIELDINALYTNDTPVN